MVAALALAAPALAADPASPSPDAPPPPSTPTPVQVAAAAATVARAGPAGRTFLERHLPAPLLEVGPRGLHWWQWLALPVALALALVLGWLLGWMTRRVLGNLAKRTETTWDDLLLERLGPPITFFWSLVVATAVRPALALDGAFDDLIGRALKAGFFLAVFWGAFRAIDVAFGALAEAPAARRDVGLRGHIPLLRKAAKVAALAFGLIAVLHELGFQVTSLLAGLGIGGLAVALAAQKTVENLIGSVTIGVDQPFRVGDFVAVDGIQGTVEQVGMRSTRLRTLDRTLVTMPNGKLADLRIESFAARDRYRLAVTLGLSYSTTAAQMRQVTDAIRTLLASHPANGPDAPVVRFTGFADSALTVEVMAWLVAADFDAFASLRGEIYLRIMEIVEQGGTRFAFPTRTVQLVPPAGTASATTR